MKVFVPCDMAATLSPARSPNKWRRGSHQRLHEYVVKGGGGLHPSVLEAEKRLT